jgi:hypothetical protein
MLPSIKFNFKTSKRLYRLKLVNLIFFKDCLNLANYPSFMKKKKIKMAKKLISFSGPLLQNLDLFLQEILNFFGKNLSLNFSAILIFFY